MLLKLARNIALVCLFSLLLEACSSVRHVPADSYLLKKNHVTCIDAPKDISKSDLKGLIKQQPNSKVLGFPVKLKFYSMTNNKDNGWQRFLHRLGEAPVVFDSSMVERSIGQMQAYLMSKGHFEGQISFDSKIKRRKIRTYYTVNPGPGYSVRQFQIHVNDDSLSYLEPVFKSFSTIKSGQSYQASALNKLRNDISQFLLNRGYYAFGKECITFYIDSSLNSYQMDITLHIRGPEEDGGTIGHHRRYRIGAVYVYPEYKMRTDSLEKFDTTIYTFKNKRRDTSTKVYYIVHSEPLRTKPGTIIHKLQLQPGAWYHARDVDRTYDNLTEMRIFRYTNIGLQANPVSPTETPTVDVRVETKQAATHSWEAQAEVTTSSGLQGAAGNISYQNKNLFGRAEIFNIKLRGAIEVQYLFDRKKQRELGLNMINNVEINLESSLEIPRFLAPISLSRFSPSFKPKTLINIGYNFQNKPAYYNRSIVNGNWGYTWRQNRWSHAFFPVEINVVDIQQTQSFADKIDSMSQLNKRLKYQYADHFILNANYTFVYNEQVGNRNMNFNYVRFSVEAAGNLLDLGCMAFNAKKNELGQYELFKMAFAQYLRMQLDVKRYFVLGRDQTFVLRGMLGGGFVYGNSRVLPYEKGFFAGGTNNIRAWPLNLLGPGSYYDPTKPTIERVGDMVLVANAEYRFPIYSAFKGAVFVDAGNIWLTTPNAEFPNGEFKIKKFFKDLAIGAGIGLRLDIGFFLIRLDAAIPFRDPARPDGQKWTFSDMRFKNIILNFGIGYPF